MKMLAGVLVLAFLAIGLVGLILPIIPGLLFLAIAGFIVLTYFPSVDERLRQYPAIGKHLDDVDRFRNLSLPRKVQVAGLLCVKVLLDGLALVASLVARLRGPSRGR